MRFQAYEIRRSKPYMTTRHGTQIGHVAREGVGKEDKTRQTEIKDNKTRYPSTSNAPTNCSCVSMLGVKSLVFLHFVSFLLPLYFIPLCSNWAGVPGGVEVYIVLVFSWFLKSMSRVRAPDPHGNISCRPGIDAKKACSVCMHSHIFSARVDKGRKRWLVFLTH